MFRSARIKLTAWYLLIIMVISLSFSGVIYVGMCRELERGFRRAEIRYKAEELGILLPRRWPMEPENLDPRLRDLRPRFFLVEDIEAAKKKLGLNLLMVNGAILGFSALAGYFLAGKTLRPIENALEEQKRFVADASHELRTPLTAFKTTMEVALRDKKMSLVQAKDLIRDNLEEINSLQSLSDKLLSLACYQSNGKSLVFEEIEISEAIKDAYRKILPMAKEKNIAITLKIRDQILKANKESLKEMLLIFLDNSIKYTPQGGKVAVATEVDKKWLVIKVKDTGIGIAKEDLPHIFDRFYRADQSRSRSHLRGGPPTRRDSSDGGEIGGFGLGLSLAKRIIEIHKGIVKVESILGKGTAFTIKLPLKR